jgi:hypothetical protein
MTNSPSRQLASERIGHSNVGFTMQTYVQRSPGLDKEAAASIAGLIMRGGQTG